MTEPAARPGISRLAILAFVAGVALTVALLGIKAVAAGLAGTPDDTGIAAMLGMVLVTGLLFDTVTVVLGHVALHRTVDGARRGRALAAAGLALGYLHLVFWAFRIVGALLSVGVGGDFVVRNFWLA